MRRTNAFGWKCEVSFGFDCRQAITMFLMGYVVLSFYFWSSDVTSSLPVASIVCEPIHLLSAFEGDYYRRIQSCS